MGEIRVGKECKIGTKEHKNGNEGTVLPWSTKTVTGMTRQ